MNAKPAPPALTDAAWNCSKDLIPPPKPGGHPRTLDRRAVVHAIFYVVDGGIPWRMLPHAYPQWPSVSWDFSPWRASGDWQRLHDTLRAQVRHQEGRHTHPTAGARDRQSVTTTTLGGERGYESGPKGQRPPTTSARRYAGAPAGRGRDGRLGLRPGRGALALGPARRGLYKAAAALGRRDLAWAVGRVGRPA